MELNKKLSQIQAKLKAKKSKFNSFGKYNYRSAEDILEALKPYLIEHNVTVVINESIEEQAGLLIMNSVATISDGDTEIQAVALVAVDMEQRGMNAPQKFGSASSYGKKYALGNLFLIDDTADSDAT
ncbi:MAG: ERF family protein, partial [Clostridium sp.]